VDSVRAQRPSRRRHLTARRRREDALRHAFGEGIEACVIHTQPRQVFGKQVFGVSSW
jgi:hypothetical protein